MSDDSDIDYDSDKNSSDDEHVPHKKITINIGGNNITIPTINNDIHGDDSEISDSESNDSVISDTEISDDSSIQLGGAEDDSENEVNNSDDEEKDIELKEDEIKEEVVKKPKNTEKKIVQIDLDPEDDDDDDYDDSYLKKFNNELTKNYIHEFHPECLNHNYDEIAKLTVVVRDSNNIIVDPLHKTIPFLTKYEKARILGQRAKQIETGAKPFVNVPENIIDSHIIAELELKEKRIPFIIRRPIPGGACEYWNLKDLENISF